MSEAFDLSTRCARLAFVRRQHAMDELLAQLDARHPDDPRRAAVLLALREWAVNANAAARSVELAVRGRDIESEHVANAGAQHVLACSALTSCAMGEDPIDAYARVGLYINDTLRDPSMERKRGEYHAAVRMFREGHMRELNWRDETLTGGTPTSKAVQRAHSRLADRARLN